MAKSKFTISLLGFDQRSADMLGEATRRTMQIVDPISKDDTQVVVVDIDGPEGMAIWENFRQQWPHMPAVVTSENEPNINQVSFAEKPFTVEALIDNITEAMILAPAAEEEPEEISVAPTETATEEGASLTPEPDSEPALEEITENVGESLPAFDRASEAITDTAQLEEISPESSMDTPDELSLETIADDTDESLPPLGEATPAITAAEEVTNEETDETITELALTEPELDEPDLKESLHEETDEAVTETEPGEPETELETTTAESKDIEDDTFEAPARDKAMPPLSQIAGILSSHTSSNSDSTIRKLDTPNPDENYFDPDAHIIGLVLKGITEGEETGAIAKLACLLDRTIYVDASNKRVCSNLKDIHMRQIAIAPLGKGENGLDTQLEMIESKSLEELAGLDGSMYPMESFVWELAVLTSKGRAPKGTPMDEPTYLMQWPNFTRLSVVPYAMKVAAYWLRLPSSLYDLSENLDVPLCDILSLYSAASLTGLAGTAKRNSDRMLRPGKPEKHEKRNLFGSIMGSLKKNN